MDIHHMIVLECQYFSITNISPLKASQNKSNHHPELESTLGCADKFDEDEGQRVTE